MSSRTDDDAPITRAERDELIRLLRKLVHHADIPPTRYLKVDEAAERLGISRAHLYRLFDTGKIRRHYFGSSPRVLESDLEGLAVRRKR